MNIWLETDAFGLIVGISREAARLFGLSQRGALTRDVRLFFPASYHSLSALMRSAELLVVETEGVLHPRDRRPRTVRIRLAPYSPLPASSRPAQLLRWTVSEREEERASAQSGRGAKRSRAADDAVQRAAAGHLPADVSRPVHGEHNAA